MNINRFLMVLTMMMFSVQAAEFSEAAWKQLERTRIKTNAAATIAYILQQEFESAYGATTTALSCDDQFIQEFGSRDTTVASVLVSLPFTTMVRMVQKTGVEEPFADAAKLYRIFYKAIMPGYIFDKLAEHNMLPSHTGLVVVPKK